MNTANTLYLSALRADEMQPSIVEEVSENEMYVGYCAPDCTSIADKKWLIKRIYTNDKGEKTIFLSNGSRKMNVAWSDRKNGSVLYAPTIGWKDKVDPSQDTSTTTKT